MNTVRIPNPNFSEKIFHNPVLARLNNSNPQERREIQRRLALDYNQLRSVGEINEPATQIFRSYLLQEGATTSNSSGGKPQSMVYGLIDPEEAVIAINTPQGATKFSNIVHNAILTNQENANMHGNPIDDLKYTGYQVIIGDPGEPATAIRQQVKDFNIVGDQVKLTVIPNIIYPKSPQVLQYANFGIEDPRYH